MIKYELYEYSAKDDSSPLLCDVLIILYSLLWNRIWWVYIKYWDPSNITDQYSQQSGKLSQTIT